VTDVDFMTTNFNTVQNMQKSTSSDVASVTSQLLKRPRGITTKFSKQATSPPLVKVEPATIILTPITPINLSSGSIQNQKGKGKLSDLALNCLEPVAINNTQDRRTRVEDTPDEEDEDNLKFLHEQKVEEVHKKTKSGRVSKKSKK
ncbi:28747_t:CDS:2, partial [Gigaspora margarita]